MLSMQNVQRIFRVQANFEEPIMNKFISFLRFVEFDENVALLYQIKGQWTASKRQNPNDSDDMDGANTFQADDIPTISIQNERNVWQRIRAMCIESLARYPASLGEDYEMLKREDLTFNERNCVLFRSGEKEILVFLLDLGEYVLKLLGMTFKSAKKASQTLPPKMDSCRDYIQNHCIRLLQTNETK